MYQAQQLVSLACQICRCPGKLTQAGQLFNMLLWGYAQLDDFAYIRKTFTLNIGPQEPIPYFYALPSDYLRMYDIFYNVLGQPFYLAQMELSDLDRAYTAEGINNYPEQYATDTSSNPQPTAGSSPSIAFYPPPAVPLVLTVRYFPTSVVITNPESSSVIPWFQDQLTLLTDLCAEVGTKLADDQRGVNWRREAEDRMRKFLIMDDDKEGYSQTVKLDPRQFRRNANLPPSKKLGF